MTSTGGEQLVKTTTTKKDSLGNKELTGVRTESSVKKRWEAVDVRSTAREDHWDSWMEEEHLHCQGLKLIAEFRQTINACVMWKHRTPVRTSLRQNFILKQRILYIMILQMNVV